MWYAEDTKKEVYEDMDKQQYICPKCGNRSYEADQLQRQAETLQSFLIYKIKSS